MTLETSSFNYPNGKPRLLYRCWFCGATHGAHPDGNPVGIPADKATRDARKQAHVLFEELLLLRGWKRKKGYCWLAAHLQIAEADAHMGKMDLPTVTTAIIVMEAKIAELRKERGTLPSQEDR